MLCQECQERESQVHVAKIVNGQKQELYLCKECAQKKGELDFGFDFSFNNLLKGLLNQNPQAHHNIDLSNEQLKCKNCDLSYREFSRSGRLGCSKCYNQFGDRIDSVLRRIHSSDNHIGKAPKRIGKALRIKREIDRLKREMDQVVKREEFEEAAEIRDKIKELEDKLE